MKNQKRFERRNCGGCELGAQARVKYNSGVDELMIDAGLVLLGAGGGALWRKVVQLYGSLVDQLSKSLKTEVEHERELEEQLKREALHQAADKVEAAKMS